LVNSTLEPAGPNCVNGGIRIDVGVDDDANGVLETSEIDQTQYVCDGGSSSNTMLTTITSPLESMNCDAGGQVISHGLDNGEEGGIAANGVLESGEIDSTTTVCSKDVTEMVMDINSGENDSAPNSFTAIGNTLYFQANNGINGTELWMSDGTEAGMVMVKDINSGSGSSNPFYFTAIGNTLYFRANDGTNGFELWKSNGTEAGTVMVKDINSGENDSDPYGLTAIGNTLYFRANDGINGSELWMYKIHTEVTYS
jgi:ELWxxDGT repeat protein